MAAKKKAVIEETVEPVVIEEAVAEEPVVVEETVAEEPVAVEEPVKIMAKVFDCDRLNFRKAQNVESDILAVLDSTSEIEIVSAKNDWTKVKVNGKTGYVMSKYIQAI